MVEKQTESKVKKLHTNNGMPPPLPGPSCVGVRVGVEELEAEVGSENEGETTQIAE
jgi:hypothetical protein